jgi:hypothetical protein
MGGKKEPAGVLVDSSVPGGPPPPIELAQELEQWIGKDNVNFIQDMMLFDHTYFKYVHCESETRQ